MPADGNFIPDADVKGELRPDSPVVLEEPGVVTIACLPDKGWRAIFAGNVDVPQQEAGEGVTGARAGSAAGGRCLHARELVGAVRSGPVIAGRPGAANVPPHLELVLVVDPGELLVSAHGPVDLLTIVDFPLIHAPPHAALAVSARGHGEVGLKGNNRRGILGGSNRIREAPLGAVTVLEGVKPTLPLVLQCPNGVDQDVGIDHEVIGGTRIEGVVVVGQAVAERAGIIRIRSANRVAIDHKERDAIPGVNGMVDLDRPRLVRCQGRGVERVVPGKLPSRSRIGRGNVRNNVLGNGAKPVGGNDVARELRPGAGGRIVDEAEAPRRRNCPATPPRWVRSHRR